MRQRFFIIVVLLSPATLRASEVNVDSWSLSSLIHAHGVGFAGDGTGAVANPFHKVDHAALPSPGGATSTVDAEYSASWSGDNFIFLIEMTHAAAGNPLSLVTRSSANIWIVPEVDSTLRIDAEYNYALGPGIRTALMETTIFQENASTGEVFIYGYQEYAVTLGDPPVGQFTLDSPDIPLPAGSRYLLGYR
ncbi:MAG TPA: hypothetical protein VNT79_05170, partial [Phycisphaerae bacterium]|nr:hypothetical protein [Phycisphaerae bacterium]